ncbi:DUF3999 family protein [Paenibacillus glacialis]|uniref:DUF3999 domain-containing protein n=1 Tax=Paenibacillus glacialis TaxID=494026 RepID=A0A168JLM5_9BACL|nr:DUF3999 family protein [Paenibacillus glacialis]OAB40802.1 hypothetical protein PGLA_17685 [Paenibacillus glacialis]
MRTKELKQILRASLILALVCVFLGKDVYASGEQDKQQEWRFSKAIELQGSGAYHALFIDEEVYARADEDLRDLRIVDQKGQYVPYYIDSGYGEAKEQSKTYSSTLIRTALKDGNTLLDYKITPVADNVDIQGNLLTVELPKEDFLKHILVQGSYDGNQWEPLEQNGQSAQSLYRTDQLVKDSISLGEAYKFEYYRLIVLNNVEKLKFPSLQLIHNSQDFQWLDYKKIGNPSFEVKQEDRHTQIIVDNESRLRINEVLLLTKGSNFTRSYELYDDQGVSIDTVGEQTVYRLDFKEVPIMNNTITVVSPIRSPKFTIQINNLDDAPLDITGVAIEHILDKLVFEAKGQGPYKLLYGNTSATGPQYDIVNFKSHIEQEDIALGKLSKQVTSQVPVTKEDPVWWLQQKVWFNGIIIIVSILLILLLIKKMKLKP